jgi:hypothetical protein
VLPKGSDPTPCSGPTDITEICNEQTCPAWTQWTDWTPCTKSCGGGKKSRKRDCIVPTRDAAAGCVGPADETADCSPDACPVWTEWTDWTACSASCGGGLQTRNRECVLPKGAAGCSGSPAESRTCSEQDCPVWTAWTPWTQCTVSCGGGGTRFKVRECVLPAVRGVQQCPGPDRLSEVCGGAPCPRLTPWSGWSDCTRSCGGGTRTRERQCVRGDEDADVRENSIDSDTVDAGVAVSENDCQAPLQQTDACNTGRCPEYGDWSEWTPCTRSCGGGTRKKVILLFSCIIQRLSKIPPPPPCPLLLCLQANILGGE